MRLIDADALMASLGITAVNCIHCAWVSKPGWTCSRGSDFEDACCAIEDAPTIEPERKRGKWIHGREVSREMIGDAVTAIFYEGWECSECHALVEDGREPLWNYCPNCGADMRGEQK